ncbi:MAG TPA: COX15/CtaA family protein [Ktedonobacteraceae bacterium]
MIVVHRLLKIAALVTSLGAYVMVLLGVLVTTTGSGQGCGNTWPFCRGEIIPGTLTIKGLVEYSHRTAAGADGLLVLILAVCAWIFYRKDFRVRVFAALSLLFVVLQGALGAVTVAFEGKWELPWLLSIHFGLSLIAFASVILLTIRLFQLPPDYLRTQDQRTAKVAAALPQLQYPLLGLMIFTYLVVYSGALVEHTGAVAACGMQLPLCDSTLLPGLSSLAGIQVLHRYCAGLLWLLTLALLILVVRCYRARRDVLTGAWWAMILITLQAISGALNVLTAGQLMAALVHTTLIVGFFSTLCYLCMQAGWPGRQRSVAGLEEQTATPRAVAAKP